MARTSLPTSLLYAVLLGVTLLTAGCGDDATTDRPGSTYVPKLPAHESAPLLERARFALRCLTEGPPAGTGRVPLEHVHRLNLELAYKDLTGMASQTLELLAEPALQERVRGQATRNADPWINVLRLLQALPSAPPELALGWVEPVLAVPRRDALAPLRYEAVRCAGVIDDERAAPLLLAFLEADPEDRDVAVVAFAKVITFGARWRRSAMNVVLRSCGPSLWEQVAGRFAALVPPRTVDSTIADAAAWWCALSEVSGPRIDARLPRGKRAAWEHARLWLDPAVPRATGGDGGALPGYGPLPASVSRGRGWFATDLADTPVFPVFGYGYTGKLPSAETRCELGRWGYATHVASVEHDVLAESKEPRDEGLYYAALHCMLDATGRTQFEGAKAELRAILGERATPTLLQAQRIQRLIQTLPPCRDPEVWSILVRVVRELRPMDPLYRTAIEMAYESMALRSEERAEVVSGLFEADSPSAGVALHLIQRARDPVYLPVLEERLAAATDPRERAFLRRLLVFVYSGGGVEPTEMTRFVARFEGWLAREPDVRVAGMAGALCDFGAAGLAAFHRGVSGERRRAYLQAWPRDGRLMPLDIAKAVAGPVGRKTDRAEVARVLRIAYESFPEPAVPLLKLMGRRLGADWKPIMNPLVQRVRHRSPRE